MSSFALAAVTALLAAPGTAPAPATAAQSVTATSSSAATAPTRTLRIDGRRIGYRSVGRGRPVVLVQGLSGTMDAWDPTFVDALARAGHRVILFDNAGIGRTTRRSQLTIRAMAGDAHRVIRGLRLRRPDVVGWSMGGMIAQSLAVQHPRSLRRLVLLASAPGDGKATLPTPEGLAALNGAATAGNVLFPEGQEAAVRRFERNLARRRGPRTAAPAGVVRQQLLASGAWLSGSEREGKGIARLRLPVLVGGGRLDPLLPFANQRHLARVIPGATLAAYDDASHGFFLQRSRDFLPRLRRFLRAD